VDVTTASGTSTRAGIELNGINVIAQQERRGTPRQLFWPWFAGNVSVLAISYGSFFLGFGISLWQATVAAIAGVFISFALVGFISIAGRRGSAPTMVLSRAAFGVRGNWIPSIISWLLCVGWEIAGVALGTLATAIVLSRVGISSGLAAKTIAFVIVAVLIIGAGIAGFDVIMRMQAIITVLTAVLTIVYIALVAHRINWHAMAAMPNGSPTHFVGAMILAGTAYGIGWVNCAADYSRYLPRKSGAAGIVGWTALGGSLAPVVLIIFGWLLAGSSTTLNSSIQSNPIGALAAILPTWFLVPFAAVAVLGAVGGTVLDLYSSGLSLLSAGLRVPRYLAACVDGVIMLGVGIYIVYFAPATFLYDALEGFLITLGVPIAAWCGVMLADIALRRSDYAASELYDPGGRYRSVRAAPILLVVAGSVIGFGTVASFTGLSIYTWQGYLLGPLGLGGKDGTWASASLGVVLALATGLVGWLILGRRAVRAQEKRAGGADRASGSAEIVA
jgi:purine-cytosine permease-like protein